MIEKCKYCGSEAINIVYCHGKLDEISCRQCKKEMPLPIKKSYLSMLCVILILLVLYFGFWLCLS